MRGYGEIARVKIEHDGIERTLQNWAAVLSVPYPTVRMRYKRGKRTFEELFKNCPGAKSMRYEEDERKVTYQKKTVLDDLFPPETVQQLREIAKRVGLSPMQVLIKVVKARVAELAAMKDEEKKEGN